MNKLPQILFGISIIIALVVNISLSRQEKKLLKKQKTEQQDSTKRK